MFNMCNIMIRDMLNIMKRKNGNSKSNILKTSFGELHGSRWPSAFTPYLPTLPEKTEPSRLANAYVLPSQNNSPRPLHFSVDLSFSSSFLIKRAKFPHLGNILFQWEK